MAAAAIISVHSSPQSCLKIISNWDGIHGLSFRAGPGKDSQDSITIVQMTMSQTGLSEPVDLGGTTISAKYSARFTNAASLRSPANT
jgi:hypothetical protein